MRLLVQTQLEIEKALKQDPTVFDYDSVYHEIEQKKETKKTDCKTSKDRKVRSNVLTDSCQVVLIQRIFPNWSPSRVNIPYSLAFAGFACVLQFFQTCDQ